MNLRHKKINIILTSYSVLSNSIFNLRHYRLNSFVKHMEFSRKLTFKTDRLELSTSIVLFTGTRFYHKTGYLIDISS